MHDLHAERYREMSEVCVMVVSPLFIKYIIDDSREISSIDGCVNPDEAIASRELSWRCFACAPERRGEFRSNERQKSC